MEESEEPLPPGLSRVDGRELFLQLLVVAVPKGLRKLLWLCGQRQKGLQLFQKVTAGGALFEMLLHPVRFGFAAIPVIVED